MVWSSHVWPHDRNTCSRIWPQTQLSYSRRNQLSTRSGSSNTCLHKYQYFILFLNARLSTGFPFSKSKSFDPVFIKLGKYVGVHNVSALQVEYLAPKNVVITFEYITNTTGVFCVSLALLFKHTCIHLVIG